MNTKKMVLINGSPRAPKGNSELLITELARLLAVRGVTTTTACAIALSGKPAKFDELVATLREADGVWLVFPLYICTLPATLIETLEEIAARVDTFGEHRPWLTALSQCGFPNAWHNECALDACEMFAKQVGMPWRGRLSIPMGALIQKMHAPKNPASKICKVLESAVDDVLGDGTLREATIREASKPLVPIWIYRTLCNFIFVCAATKSSALMKMYATPYGH